MTKLFSYWCAAVLSVFWLNTAAMQAQNSTPRFELGVHYTTLQLSEKDDYDSGPGLRFTYNLNDYVGLETEANVLPQTREGGGNNEAQGFFGVRAGIRRERFGIFAKARPGFTHLLSGGSHAGTEHFRTRTYAHGDGCRRCF